MNKKTKTLIIQSTLAHITKFQLQSQDDKLIDYVEDLRQIIVDFDDGVVIVTDCPKCGCNELLCGYNKKN